MRIEVAMGAVALMLGACGADASHGTKEEQCMVALMDTEKALLKTDKWGEPPEAVRVSDYASHRCVRLRSILRASEQGTAEEVADRALDDCAQLIAKAEAEQDRWDRQPFSSDPAIERDYRRITAGMQRSRQENLEEAKSLLRGSAVLTVRFARPGKCWEQLADSHSAPH